MKRRNNKQETIYGKLRKYLTISDAYLKFTKFISTFRPEKVKDEDDVVILIRKFNKQQLVGAVLRNGKKMYKVTSNAELGGNGKRVTGEQELIEIKIR